MSVFYQYHDLPIFKNPVITIGSFDGVHNGHRCILKEVVKAAKDIDGESVLITFEPHPRKIIQPNIPLGLLTSTAYKTQLLLEAGIDHIIVAPFTRDFSMMSAESYVKDFLIKNFNPKKIIVGYDHRFGHSREGNLVLLKSLIGATVALQEIPAQLIDNAAVSSTKIRNAIINGNVEDAAIMLDRPHAYSAVVVHGNKIGRTIGFPTANLQTEDNDILLPGIGIYAVLVSLKDRTFKGMMSIGYRPTVGHETNITCEVNLLDFNEEIYGEHLTVQFLKRLRGEEKFESLEALKTQIAQDEINTREVLKGYSIS